MMFGINNPRLVEMCLARRRGMRSRWWKRESDARKYPKPFAHRRICRHVDLRHKALPQGMKWLKLAWLRREI
jgi:hypothetical protein